MFLDYSSGKCYYWNISHGACHILAMYRFRRDNHVHRDLNGWCLDSQDSTLLEHDSQWFKRFFSLNSSQTYLMHICYRLVAWTGYYDAIICFLSVRTTNIILNISVCYSKVFFVPVFDKRATSQITHACGVNYYLQIVHRLIFIDYFSLIYVYVQWRDENQLAEFFPHIPGCDWWNNSPHLSSKNRILTAFWSYIVCSMRLAIFIFTQVMWNFRWSTIPLVLAIVF